MTLDVAAYIFFGIGTLFLTFAGLYGSETNSVRIVSLGIGAVMIVVAVCLYWQDSTWKRDAASRSISPSVLRAKLEDQVEQTFQQKRANLITTKAPPAQIEDLYRW